MANWRNKINLKEYLTDDETDEQVLICVNALIPQLENVLIREKGLTKTKLDEYFLNEFEELIEEFKWIRESINKGENSSGYDFFNWCEALNNYLEELYNIGDTMIEKKDFYNDIKFLWIG